MILPPDLQHMKFSEAREGSLTTVPCSSEIVQMFTDVVSNFEKNNFTV